MKSFLQIASLVLQLCALIPIVLNWRKSSLILRNRTYLVIDGGDAEGNSAGSSSSEAMELLLTNLKNIGLPISLILAGFGVQVILILL
jgi:hypothetical protein